MLLVKQIQSLKFWSKFIRNYNLLLILCTYKVCRTKLRHSKDRNSKRMSRLPLGIYLPSHHGMWIIKFPISEYSANPVLQRDNESRVLLPRPLLDTGKGVLLLLHSPRKKAGERNLMKEPDVH